MILGRAGERISGMKAARARLSRPFACGGFGKGAHESLVMMLEGPGRCSLPDRPRTGDAMDRIEKLGHVVGKLLMIVRIVNDVAIARRVQ